MAEQERWVTETSVKTVEIKTVKLGRKLASTKGSPENERAEFARKFVEESIARSKQLFAPSVAAKAELKG